MSLKFFILGLCVLVSFVQVKTQNNDQIQNNVLDGKPNQFRSMELESRQKRSEDEDEKGTTKKKRENSVDEAPKAKQEDARRFNPFEAVGKFVEAPGKIVIAQAMKKLYETYTNNDKPFGPTYDTTYGSPPSGRRMNGDNPPPEEVRMSSMAQRQPEVKMSSMVQPPPGYNYGQPGYYGGNYMQYGTPVQTSMHSYTSPVRKYHTYGNSIPDYGNTYVQNSMPGYESHSNSIPGFGPSHPAKISTQYSYATSQPTYGQLSTNSYQGMNQNDGSPYFQNRRANSGMNKDLPEKIKHNYGKMVKTVNAEFIKSKNHKTVDPDISLRNGFIGDVFQKDLDNKSSEETTQVEYEIPALGSAAEIASDADIAVGNRRFLGKETSEENDQDENSISTVIENISSVQGQDSPADDDNDQQDEGEGETEDEIEQRRKITSIMNSAVNIIEPETERKDVYTQIQNNQMGYMGSYNPPPRPLPQRPHYPPTGAFFEPPIRQPQYIQPQPQPQPYYEPKYQAPTISQYISPQLSEFNPKPSPPSTTRAPPRPPFRLIPLPPPPPPQPSSPPPPPMVVPKETPSRPSYPSAQPPPSQGLGSIGGNPLGGLLGTILNLVTNALPLLKPLMSLLKTILPGLKNLLGPLLKSILNGFPLLSNLLKLLGPLFKLPAKILQLLSAIGGCLKSIFGVLLKGFKFLMKGFKILLNLLPVLPAILDFIPELIEKLWRIWRSIRYIVLYPIRLFKRSLQRVARLLYGIPRYLGLIMRSIAHFLVSPVAILGFLFKRGFLLFHDYVITPVTRLKYFLIHLFDVLVGPLNIIRHFIMELICLVFKTPARIIRSIMRSIFVNGILNTIRYIKTVIYEIIVFPWSRHYADMFPSAGNIHNYLIPSQAIPCRGVAC